MPRITATTEARSLDDLTSEWKVIARMQDHEWSWLGDFGLLNRANNPRSEISTVTGRDADGGLVLYGRWAPETKGWKGRRR